MSQHHLAPVRRVAMLEHINPLPGAQRQPALVQRNADRGLGQRRTDMRRHVVGPLGGVAEARPAGRQPMKEIAQVLLHIGIGIFLDQQRGRSVADETGEQSVFDLRAAHKIRHGIGKFVKPGPAGRNRNGVERLFHVRLRK
jgi:hypothetical protein